MCNDCIECAETIDDSCDMSSDVSCDTSMDMGADYKTELQDDIEDISNDGSDDLPDGSFDDAENLTGEEQQEVEVKDLCFTNECASENADDLNDSFDDDSCDEPDGDDWEGFEDGSEDLPDGMDDPAICDETGNLRVMDNEEYLSLSPEQQEQFEQRFDALSQEDQDLYRKQFAQADLERYKSAVNNGEIEQDDRTEQELNDIIDGKYQGDDDFSSTLTEYCAAAGMSAVGTSIGLDPLTKAELTSQAGDIGRLYGSDAMEKIARTAYVQNGIHIPTPVMSKNNFGNEIRDYGKGFNVQDGSSLHDQNITESSNHENTENADDKSNQFLRQAILKAGADFEGGGKSVFELQTVNAGQIKLPKEDGYWSNERGNSLFYPQDKDRVDILKKYGVDSVEYIDDKPDFSPFIVDEYSDIKISTFGDNRMKNFSSADRVYAAKKGISPVEARRFRKNNQLTWHEIDSDGNMILIPQEVHSKFVHSGGISEIKKMRVDKAKQAVEKYRNLKVAKPTGLNFKERT